jgi:hypothetical protein
MRESVITGRATIGSIIVDRIEHGAASCSESVAPIEDKASPCEQDGEL